MRCVALLVLVEFSLAPVAAAALTRPPSPATNGEVGGVLALLSAEARSAPTPRLASPAAVAPPTLSPRQLDALIAACAPTTPATVIRALIETESSGRVLLVAQNAPVRRSYRPATGQAAESLVAELAAQRANFDIGLMQVNSATAARLGIEAQSLLDPCRNIAAGSAIFDRGYAKAFGSGHAVMPIMSAYSLYNTGALSRGLTNGYADHVSLRLRLNAKMGQPTALGGQLN